jgi:hypothetical protein
MEMSTYCEPSGAKHFRYIIFSQPWEGRPFLPLHTSKGRQLASGRAGLEVRLPRLVSEMLFTQVAKNVYSLEKSQWTNRKNES